MESSYSACNFLEWRKEAGKERTQFFDDAKSKQIEMAGHRRSLVLVVADVAQSGVKDTIDSVPEAQA